MRLLDDIEFYSVFAAHNCHTVASHQGPLSCVHQMKDKLLRFEYP